LAPNPIPQQARADKVAAQKTSVASPAPIMRRGAGAASPFSVHVSTGADGVHVHVAAPVDPSEVQNMRRQIESFFAERGLRVHLHINGARVDGQENTHG
jgi:predicted ATP-grasp superfamily ATP-dependent carboligase